jgi:hypothetical protein
MNPRTRFMKDIIYILLYVKFMGKVRLKFQRTL